MRKPLLILIALLSALMITAQTKPSMNYDSSWKKAADFEQKSLPKSAYEEVNKILLQAIADKNSPQVIKALIHQGKYDLAIDAENDTLIFRNLNDMLAKSKDVVEKSVLHSMLGELYLQYYQKDQWEVNQRTKLGDVVPADMKEWTKNIFYSKVVEHLNASLQAQASLEKAQVQSYAAVVELGKDSRRFFPSMYDFLARRALDVFKQIDADEDVSRVLARKNITQQSLFAPADEFVKLPFDPQPSEYGLWVLETYKTYLKSLVARKMDKSVVLVELDKLDYLNRFLSAYEKNALPSLEKMLQEWKGNEFSVEIVDKITDFQMRPVADTPENASDSPAQLERTKNLYNLLKTYIDTYPNYERIGLLQNKLNAITQPAFSATGNSSFPLKGEKKLHFTYKNVSRVTVSIYKSDAKNAYLSGNNIQKSALRNPIKQFTKNLTQGESYQEMKDSIALDINDYGAYFVTFETDKPTERDNNSAYAFSVTDLTVFSRALQNESYDFVVVNRTSGEPQQDAQISVYEVVGNWRNRALNLVGTYKTNGLGMLTFTKPANKNQATYVFHAAAGNDASAPMESLPYTYNYSRQRNANPTQEQLAIFTDRGLYRPGQTVYFKALAMTLQNENPQPVSNENYTVDLYDANYQKIATRELKSNEFGSISGEFALPQGALTGNFSIRVNNQSVNFRVEEYKRPTFEITFDKIEKTYKFGEEITLKGKAETYSGIKLQNAVVNYTVNRQRAWWWGRWGSAPAQFAEGSATTDENGQFSIAFTPEKGDDESGVSARFYPSAYSFVVETTITDLNGETQTATYTVTVGDVSMMLEVVASEQIEKSASEIIRISAKNLDGNDIFATGTYRVFAVQENDSIAKEMLSGTFETGEQKELTANLKSLPSEKYRVKLLSKDDQGNPVETEKDIILFSYSDKRPPIKTNNWFVMKSATFSKNKNAEVILGVSDENVRVLYELWRGQTLLERKWLTMSNENKTFSFPYKTEYKDGLSLFLTYVKDEKFYESSVNFTFEQEDKTLSVKLDVFRDKIRPGADEEWRVTVKDAAGKPSLAEVLASMYDLSLDQIFESPRWQVNVPRFWDYSYVFPYRIDNSYRVTHANLSFPYSAKDVKSFVFDQFKWFDFSFYNYGTLDEIVVVSHEAFSTRSAKNILYSSPQISKEASNEIFEVVEEQPVFAGIELNDKQEKANIAPQIRRNFNETAFFFPQLRTNEKGETQIAFRVPDSNTRWRFRVLAHDKNLNVEQAEAIAVSQKELMVTPNMPRFLRQGDKASISTKISNLSDGAIDGTVRIEFFDMVTEKTIENISVENPSKPFLLAKDASSDAAWTFDVPSDIELIGVRVIAQSASFSDGEQHALAVLPNRMLVTESMRMDVNGTQAKSFTMNRLTENASPTAQNYRLTLEFASNPAWYAVQALPVLNAPDNENAVSWFAAYYANTLGAHIGKAYPKVSAMIIMWKLKGGTSETLFSNLEKNQELKNVLLEETPWVLEAKNEAEQKQKLALLFDLNRSENLTRQAIDKLKELQTSQGGWSWFKGFYPSVSITQYLLYGFNQLKELQATTFGDDVRAMQSAAVSYVDAEAFRRFESLKKYNNNWRGINAISSTDLEYLYVRSAYTQYPQDAKIKEMTAFYTSVIEKNWTQFPLYERSLIAVLMQRGGKTAVVQDILKSYREHATVSDEMGMFWANNRAHVFMSQSAVSVHTFIMDAFRVGGAKADEMDNMKRWLLKQKQTQLWESTHATLDAVYALLSTGSDWFSTQGATTITLGNQTVEPAKTELGTGYFKESWSRGEIRPEMGNVKVAHNGNAPAWGALYLQYFEALDNITKTDASLDVEKLLFVEQTDASGKKLVRITETNPLKVGDKVVVRLTVRADRDLEFVHLKNMRAACFEPAEQLSGLRWQNGAPYYQTSKDASTNFYFDVLPRGTYVFEYAVFVNRTGSYSNGITTIQCLYAPEFTSHTGGIRINVK